MTKIKVNPTKNINKYKNKIIKICYWNNKCLIYKIIMNQNKYNLISKYFYEGILNLLNK
jgi:hypothetical protein